MAKNKDPGTKETGTKMDPARIKSIVIRSVITFILITLVIVIIVLMTVPTGLRTQPITSFEYYNDGNNTLIARWGTSGSGTVDPNSSFAGSWVSGSGPALVGVEMTINNLGRVIVPGSWSIGDNGQSIFTFANLQYDAAAHTLKLISSTANSGSGTTTTETTISGYTNFANIMAVSFNASNTQIILSVLQTLIPLLFVILMIWWMVRMVRRGMGGGDGEGADNVFTIGRSQAKLAKSDVRFSDVAGIEEEKNELIEIVDYLKNPGRYAQMGARVPRGVILYGPPGTGKTLLAKAVAGEAGVPFFQVTGSAFEDMLVGVGARRVRELFAKAKKASPCIVFIDEIDSVGSKRSKMEMTNYSVAEQTLNQMLAEMDGFNNRTGVVVMAATNRLDVLDDALLRPGRFDRHIQVTLPDVKEREAILKIHAANKNLSAKVSLEDIARRTPGFSGAQLENVLNEATLLAVRARKNAIGMDDLDEAIDRVMAGPAKKSRVMSEADKKLTAYHEAGHALVGLHLQGADEVQKITIIPRGQAGGYTLSTPKDAEMLMKRRSDLLSLVAGALGGRAAEEIIFGAANISTGASNDFYKATNIVRTMVTQLGMSRLGLTQFVPSEGGIPPSIKLYSDKTAEAIDAVINEIISEQYEVAKKVIAANREEHELIAQALLLQETIVKKDIDFIHKNKKLPPEAISIKQRQAREAAAKANKLKPTEEAQDDGQPDGTTQPS